MNAPSDRRLAGRVRLPAPLPPARHTHGLVWKVARGFLLTTLLLMARSDAAAQEPVATFRTDHATLAISAHGALSAITRLADGRGYLAAGQPAPLLSVRVNGHLHAPNRATFAPAAGQLTLQYSDLGARAVLQTAVRPTHVVFELIQLQPTNLAELVLWGPYPTTIREIIGEVIGVVRDDSFAVGIQALNAKTLGGYPRTEDDIEGGDSADDLGDYPNLPAELKKGQAYRGDTARQAPFGSVLQAFCRHRDRDRLIANWGHEQFVAPAFADGGVIGSKIALFAVPAAAALDTLGAIELAEGLPHPLLDGVWGKQAPNANGSYLIVDFGENTIERAIDMTKRAGLAYLYHSSPFATWGHFQLKPDLFPHGREGLRTCVEKAKAAGVRIGIHTLSNFITPNDPYVTPKPDPRLARIGTSRLAAGVDAEQQEIAVAEPQFFRKKTAMNTVAIGDELIRFASLSAEPPWRLLDCERGAWGTRAAPHPPGAPVGRLLDHDYKVFLTDAHLTQEVARNLADLCNFAGTRQISLDGLEGCWSTGLGQYGRTLFTLAWYEALAPDLRGQINDASNPGHFNWHVYTRMNWGEPWYAGFRESQTLYRFKNQLHFERNLMPHMLGWFALRPDTSLEDAEWLLARAAGFDAGFALAASLASTAQLEADPTSAEAARQFGALPGILAAIRQWETARLAGAFPPSVKALLRDNLREFHLQPVAPGRWDLFEVRLARAELKAQQPTSTDLTFDHSEPAQPLQWILRSSTDTPLGALRLVIDGRLAVELKDAVLPARGALKYGGGATATLQDATWKETARVTVATNATWLRPGSHRVTLAFDGPGPADCKLELRTLGPATRIVAPPVSSWSP